MLKEKDRIETVSAEFGRVQGILLTETPSGYWKVKYDNGQIRSKAPYDLKRIDPPVAEVIGYQVEVNGVFQAKIFESAEAVNAFTEGVKAVAPGAVVNGYSVSRTRL
jgi:hypothetical protein